MLLFLKHSQIMSHQLLTVGLSGRPHNNYGNNNNNNNKGKDNYNKPTENKVS